jgi:uncharacterized membrane protein YdbT with pleckstrin-like domain
MTIIWAGESKSLTSMATGGKIVTAKYKVTTEYVYLDTGVLSTKGEQVPMWAIRDCDVKQSLMQRTRGVSNLILMCEHNDFTGKKEFVLEDIEGARELRDLINSQSKTARIEHESQQKTQIVNYTGAQVLPQTSVPSSDDAVEKLEKLAALLEKGLISEDEFKTQKMKILGM